MKRLSLVAACVVSFLGLTAAPLTITHTTAGGLEAELNAAIEADPDDEIASMADITDLTIVGDAAMNATDFVAIRTHLRPSLQILDMSAAVFTNNTIPGSLYDQNGVLNNMHSLVSVKIPETIVTISGGCFYNCENLESVNLPEGLTQIWHYTFRGCKKINFDKIPDGVKVFNPYCFYQCNALTTDALPPNTTKILGHAFNESSVTFTELPATVNEIGEQAFRKTSVQFSSVPEGITALPASVFSGTKVTIDHLPSSVKTIGQCLFQSVKTIDLFTIPDQANLWTTIPTGMFYVNEAVTRTFICRAPAAPKCAVVNGSAWDECFGKTQHVGNTTFKVLASAMESFQATAPYSSMNLVALTTPVVEPVVEMPEGYDASNLKIAFVVNGVEHTDLTEEVLEGDGEFVITFAEDAEMRLYIDEVRYVAAAAYADGETEETPEETVDPDQLYKVADAATATKQDVKVPLTVVPDMRQLHVKVGYNATLSGIDTTEAAAETTITRRGDIFYLSAPGAQVYDMAGRVVASTAANTIDIASLPAGAYLLHAGKTVKKILK